jgi:DNA repair protein RAD50
MSQPTTSFAQTGRCHGSEEELKKDIRDRQRELAEPRLKDAAKNWAKRVFECKILEAVVKDMDRYYRVLDKAIMTFHREKMAVINRILRDLWRQTYKGNGP